MIDRNDDTLMHDYAGGDENALRILVERWERPVFAFLFRMLGSSEEAEDLCQDTFMNVIKAANRYQPDGKFQSWLFRIAGNKARSRLRRRKILRWLPLSEDQDSLKSSSRDALAAMEDAEDHQQVREAIAALPERQREAIVLKQYHDMSYQEIADTMGASVNSVQMLLHRAMSALRKDLTSRRKRA